MFEKTAERIQNVEKVKVAEIYEEFQDTLKAIETKVVEIAGEEQYRMEQALLLKLADLGLGEIQKSETERLQFVPKKE